MKAEALTGAFFGESGRVSSLKGTAFISASCLHFNVSILRESLEKLCYIIEILNKKNLGQIERLF